MREPRTSGAPGDTLRRDGWWRPRTIRVMSLPLEKRNVLLPVVGNLLVPPVPGGALLMIAGLGMQRRWRMQSTPTLPIP